MNIAATFIYGESIMFVFGGLALFIFGINMMSDSLKAAAGNKLKAIIEKSTNTPLKGILVGIFLTVLIQSSSGTTALMIGLMRAGLMTLPQSVGIIMGANIGTTVTAFIIGLPIADFGLYYIFFGLLMSFVKNRRIHHFGGVLLGLGMLFVGLDTMSSGLKPLVATQTAEDMFQLFSQNWFLGTVFGTVFTAVVQSSSAAIGVLQRLYDLNAQGIDSITIQGAVPILLGANIGTTITAFIASIGGNTESKRAAFIHILFNVISAVFFLIILIPYENVLIWFEARYLEPYSMLTIAFAHAFQNSIMTILLYFFIKQMIFLAKYFVKDKTLKQIPDEMFDEKLIVESPILALEYMKKGILYMGGIVKDYFDIARSYSFKEDMKLVNEAYTHEMMIDTYDQKLHDYLIKISQAGLEKNDSSKLSRDLDTIRDFERIGDHLTNIVEFFVERYAENHLLSEEGSKDLKEIYQVLEEMLNDTLTAFMNQDIELAKKVVKLEDKVDELEELARYRYIERLKQGQVTFIKANNFSDILANLERIGDHLMNIVGSVIEPMYVPQSILVPKPHEIDKDI
ncbi:MAG: Na/Pi cotransporter family protein [Tenericutes bacterium HGW-Tenericutes-6]|nr:MAG: Na/Pi cotransporter family protein [Tenericutes bacterium HGW-Tenericutes-6]